MATLAEVGRRPSFGLKMCMPPVDNDKKDAQYVDGHRPVDGNGIYLPLWCCSEPLEIVFKYFHQQKHVLMMLGVMRG